MEGSVRAALHDTTSTGQAGQAGQDKKCCFTTPTYHGRVDSALLHRNFEKKISGIDVRYYFSVAFRFFDRGQGESPGTSAFLEPLLAKDVNELQLYIVSDHLQKVGVI